MLNSTALSFTAQGRIRNTLDAPTHFCGGVPFTLKGGVSFLSVVFAAPTHFHQSNPFNGNQLAVVGADPDHFSQGCLPHDAAGSLCIIVGGNPDHYKSGLPFSPTNRLALATADAL